MLPGTGSILALSPSISSLAWERRAFLLRTNCYRNVSPEAFVEGVGEGKFSETPESHLNQRLLSNQLIV